MRLAAKHRTLCEVLREIMDIHQSSTKKDLKTRDLLKEAHDMAKCMNRKMLENKLKMDPEFIIENEDYVKDLKRRLKQDYVLQ